MAGLPVVRLPVGGSPVAGSPVGAGTRVGGDRPTGGSSGRLRARGEWSFGRLDGSRRPGTGPNRPRPPWSGLRRWAAGGAPPPEPGHDPNGPAATCDSRPPVPVRRALPAAALLGGVAGAVLGGPVAALALAAYGTLAARAVLRRRTRQAADLVHRRDLDRLGAVAAELRAGLPVDGMFDGGTGRIARLARAAVRLADRTGAPLAELLERVEADARAADRGLAAAAAQAAGARATAWLLAALPLGGIGLGYAIGVDPVGVLLHTPVGGGSALAAVVLQVGGLLWAERLGVGPGRAA
ncbi:type II secretion system F family protein [Micromonospora sp. NBS 11-29]|uniref:type II secretion system F family protein n=1 Tax=Micromonospora sp. NBS 11-29 TaxID=1960879 RepID=UPI003F922E97